MPHLDFIIYQVTYLNLFQFSTDTIVSLRSEEHLTIFNLVKAELRVRDVCPKKYVYSSTNYMEILVHFFWKILRSCNGLI